MTHFHLWTEASALPIKGLTLYVVELLRNHRFWYQDFVDKMRRHEERLVDADSDSERQDHTQWPDGEWLAMMAHGKHVLVSGYPVPSATTWSKLLILDPTWQTTGPTHWPLTRPEKTGCDSLALDPTRKWVWLNDVWPDPKKLGQTHWPLTWPENPGSDSLTRKTESDLLTFDLTQQTTGPNHWPLTRPDHSWPVSCIPVRQGHGKDVLVKRSTDADVSFNGENDDDPSRCKAKHVRDETIHRTHDCNINHHSVYSAASDY